LVALRLEERRFVLFEGRALRGLPVDAVGGDDPVVGGSAIEGGEDDVVGDGAARLLGEVSLEVVGVEGEAARLVVLAVGPAEQVEGGGGGRGQAAVGAVAVDEAV